MSVTRDLASNILTEQVIAPAVYTSTQTQDPVTDTVDCEAIAFQINVGAIGSEGIFTPKLQESDTTSGGDFEDVAAADLIGSFAVMEADSTQTVGYKGNKRYLRIVATKGTGTSVAFGITALKHRLPRRPASLG